MRPNRRRRQVEAVALSAAAHAALIVALVLHAPSLRVPPPERGPPEAVIPVLILPRTPPLTANPGARPSPIRLHQRSIRAPDEEEPPVAPLVIPTQPAAPPPPPGPGPRAVAAPPAPDPMAANAGRALRGLIGCGNPSLLSREERQKCEDRLAAGVPPSDFLGMGIDADKAKGLAAAARRKEEDYKYKRTAPSPEGFKPGIGSSAHGLAKALGNDRPEAKVPF